MHARACHGALSVLPFLGIAAALAGCGGGETPSARPSAAPRGATVAVPALPGSLDPAQAQSLVQRAIAVATQTPLLTYRRRGGGNDAAQLQPALADALPTLSGDHREYRLQLRSGLVYADGRLVKASDVERAIAHASVDASDPLLRSTLRAIVGAPSRDGQTLPGVRTDDRTGVVVVRLRGPDGRIPLALADPATAPMPELPRAGRVPASTGPLRVASSTARSIELAANPLRPTISTVPAAKLAQVSIVVRPLGSTGGEPEAQLRSGTTDLLLGPPGQVGEPDGGGVTQVAGPTTAVISALLPQAGPTASRTVRRALAEAIDARAFGGGAASAPGELVAACGLIPSYAVGAVERDPCPPTPVLAAREPLAGARPLIVAAPPQPWSLAAQRLLVEAVRTLGGSAVVDTVRDPSAALRAGRAQIALVRSAPQLPHPAAWLADATGLDRLLAREVPRVAAGPLTGSGGRWANLERRAVDRAVAIPLLAQQRVVAAGPQLDARSIVIHPVLGLDLAALDLR